VKNKFNKFLSKYTKYLFVLCAITLCSVCLADPATDPLAATVKPEITGLLGDGSTVMYCIYIAEIVLGGVAYIKTKNLMIFLGVPFLMLFTHAMLTYIAS
jgi:type IV conjugative transfer system pilin TraA